MGGLNNPSSLGLITCVKLSDEIVNNSTTLQDDDDLYFTVGVGDRWLIVCDLIVDATAVADFKYHWDVPAGASMNWAPSGSGSSITEASDRTEAMGGVPLKFQCRCLVRMAAAGGTVKLQWAQANLEATDTKVLIGSSLIATKLF